MKPLKIAHLELLKNEIKSGHFPKDYPHFGGANLIITNNPNRNYEKEDIVIFTEFPGSISWLVQRLKNIYVDELHYLNKHDFYIKIGIILMTSLNDKNKDLFDCLEDVIKEIEKNWIP